MAFEKRQEGNYVHIYQGKFSIEVPEGTEGAVTRINKKERTVHEIHHDSFIGRLVGIRTQDGNFGKNWLIDLEDAGEKVTVQLSYSNSNALAFLKMLPNIDVTKPMQITPQSKIEDGKTKTALFVNQDGNAIKHFYTKDEPKGIPQWEQIIVKGEKVWDSTKQIQFLEEMVKRDIVPNLPKVEATAAEENLAVEVAPEAAPEVATVPGSLDDEF